jgi:hypothetical protein
MSVYAMDEYAPAVVHELTERGAHGVQGDPATSRATQGTHETRPRSVSVVCRLCHGDLDESLFCSLCGVVTLP